MDAAALHSAIDSRRLPPVVYLFGAETYLRDRALAQIRQGYVDPATADFNLDVIEGGGVRAQALVDMANALPTFADMRLVVVREADKIPAAELESLIPYLKDPSPTTLLVLAGDKVDRRKKFFQELKKHGALVEFKELYENQIPAFVREQAARNGMRMTESAMALFCRRVGTSLQEISAELIKLSTYLGGRELADEGDVAEIVAETRAESVFKLTDAIGEKRIGDVVRLSRKLLEDGEAPLMIVAMVTRFYRQLWSAHEMQKQNLGKSEMARQIGINPYFLDGLLRQARTTSSAECRRAFELLLHTDLALKSSGAHPSALLDQLLLGLLEGAEKQKGVQ